MHDQHKVWWHGDEAARRAGWHACEPNFLIGLKMPDQTELAGTRPVADLAVSGSEDTGANLVAGVDVGGGEAETVVYLCEVKQHQQTIIKLGAWRGEDTRGNVVRFLQPYRDRLSSVRVDAIGMATTLACIADQGLPVDLVNVARPCESRPELNENDAAKRFANQKAAFYQMLADALEHDELQGLNDETTIGQLAGIVYEIDSRGRLRIEPKEKARARGVASPDRAEALMLALAHPPNHLFRSMFARVWRSCDTRADRAWRQLPKACSRPRRWLRSGSIERMPDVLIYEIPLVSRARNATSQSMVLASGKEIATFIPIA